MKIEQSQWIYDLLARYDGLFLHEHPYELDCGDGWRHIIEGLLEQFSALNLPGLKVAQIKQKFDELRCYTEGEDCNPDVAAIIQLAKDMASRTCERCGYPLGHRRCHQYQRGRAREVFVAFGTTGFNVDEYGNLWCHRPTMRLTDDPANWGPNLPHAEFCAKPGDWIHGMPDGTLRLAPWRS